MKVQLREFLLSLLSRKFLLTLLGAYALWSSHQYNEMIVLLLGYIGVQGGVDIVNKYRTGTLTALDVENAMSQNDENVVDTSKVVTGKPFGVPLFDESPKEE